MRKTITSVSIDFHPDGDFFCVIIGRGDLDDTDKQDRYIGVYTFSHGKQNASRILKRARQMQDILFNRIQYPN